MNVISLDPSLRGFGVYAVRNGVESSEVRAAPDHLDRLDALGSILSWLSRVSKQGWDLCLIEDYAFSGGTNGNSRAVTIQAEIGGIARGLFRARGVPVIEVPIGVWKSVTGISMKKGTALHKSDYINAVLKLYGKQFATVDEIDAFLFYQTVKKCGTECPVGAGARRIQRRLEELKINAREM